MLHESISNGESRSTFGVRNLALKAGPLFYPRSAQKYNAGFSETTNAGDETGHYHAMVRVAIRPHEHTDLDQLLGHNVATASPRPALNICARQDHFCIAYSASRRSSPFAEITACNDAALLSSCRRH